MKPGTIVSDVGIVLILAQRIKLWEKSGTLDPALASRATRPGHKHTHRPTFLSISGEVTPAEYRRRHDGRKA